MKELFLVSLSKALNAYLNLDPESSRRVSKLQNKAISIEFLPLHFTFQCAFKPDGIHLEKDDTLVTETTLRGTPLQLLGVMITKENRQRFFSDDIIIEGNAEFGNEVIELFDHLKIDWEEYFSKLVGDVPAYHTKRFVNKVSDWLKKTDYSMTQNISEYLHEETEWLPTREALEDFYSDIDALRMDTDRCEARINTINQRIGEEE